MSAADICNEMPRHMAVPSTTTFMSTKTSNFNLDSNTFHDNEEAIESHKKFRCLKSISSAYKLNKECIGLNCQSQNSDRQPLKSFPIPREEERWYDKLGSFFSSGFNNKLPRRTSTTQNCSILSSPSKSNQTEKIPYHPSFIEPVFVHCLGTGTDTNSTCCKNASAKRSRSKCSKDKDNNNDDVANKVSEHEHQEKGRCPDDCKSEKSKSLHDTDPDPDLDADPCTSVKFRLCPPNDRFAAIPFQNPDKLFSDFTYPEEWRTKRRARVRSIFPLETCPQDNNYSNCPCESELCEDLRNDNDGCGCEEDDEEDEDSCDGDSNNCCPKEEEAPYNPDAINYKAIGDVDDACDRDVIRLCPLVQNFNPTPFSNPPGKFTDFKPAPEWIAPVTEKESNGSVFNGDSDRERNCRKNCKKCIKKLRRELRRRASNADATSCEQLDGICAGASNICSSPGCQFLLNFEPEPNPNCPRSSCKETFDEFIARKRLEAKCEEMARLQAEREAAEACAAQQLLLQQQQQCQVDSDCAEDEICVCEPQDQDQDQQDECSDVDCTCDCPEGMECDFDIDPECEVELECIEDIVPPDCNTNTECKQGPCPEGYCEDDLCLSPETIPFCSADQAVSTEDDFGTIEECQGQGQDQVQGQNVADCGCSNCCEDPTPCQQKIFDLQTKLLLSGSDREKDLLKLELKHCKEKILAYKCTIKKAQAKLKCCQRKQKDQMNLKRKRGSGSGFDNLDVDMASIEEELECCVMKLKEAQKQLGLHREREIKLTECTKSKSKCEIEEDSGSCSKSKSKANLRKKSRRSGECVSECATDVEELESNCNSSSKTSFSCRCKPKKSKSKSRCQGQSQCQRKSSRERRSQRDYGRDPCQGPKRRDSNSCVNANQDMRRSSSPNINKSLGRKCENLDLTTATAELSVDPESGPESQSGSFSLEMKPSEMYVRNKNDNIDNNNNNFARAGRLASLDRDPESQGRGKGQGFCRIQNNNSADINFGLPPPTSTKACGKSRGVDVKSGRSNTNLNQNSKCPWR